MRCAGHTRLRVGLHANPVASASAWLGTMAAGGSLPWPWTKELPRDAQPIGLVQSKGLPGGGNKGLPRLERFDILNVIGEGTYGTVFRALDKADGERVVALKKVRIHASKEGFPRTSLREINTLMAVQHPNIIALKCVVTGPDLAKQSYGGPGEMPAKSPQREESPYTGSNSVYLVFEYCEHDVAHLLDHHAVRFSAAEVKCIFRQLLLALHHLHLHGLIHRDVKLSNLLMTNKGEIRLGDFGLARRLPPGHYSGSRADPLLASQASCLQQRTAGGEVGDRNKAAAKTAAKPLAGPTEAKPEAVTSALLTPQAVTLWYRAPELLLEAPSYGQAVDMWSAGCVLGELICGKPLFPGKDEQEQVSCF
eukprot:GHVT01101417.1.p1 GENE.GHVT01101417.1~~GHVT01101417.1.p1  ORF type:complete len:365 (-),score=63.51 GHVT01101417.1:98-1192(-)